MQKTYRWLTFGVILTLLWGITGASIPAAETTAWQTKVDSWVLTTNPGEETEFLVFMHEQADLLDAADLQDKRAKGYYVYETLTTMSETHQKPIRAFLDSLGVSYQPFWIANMLWVRADVNVVRQIAQRPDVDHIYANPQVQLSLPESNLEDMSFAPNAIEWNILKINADDVWAEGYTGQGVVVGGQDTGYDWDHPALKDQYRGWDGSTASHDYNWYDATGLSPNTPVDPHSHGTHTMGTMVGDDGANNQIGVAPGARWIGCRNMDSGGYGSPATYAACYQWFVAPTRTDGTNPRPDLAPDVINNSWSCPASEGCTDVNMLLSAVQAVRAAGILTAHSAGNSGPNCRTINEPAAIYSESFTVGSTTSSDTISSFSSRGPVMSGDSSRQKPQISAPGSGIRSTIPGGGYGYKSGTSMAAPHVAGLTALLISALPGISGHVSEIETLIERSAVALFTSDGCGGDTPTSRPNYTYGWGRIDAWAAYQALLTQELELEKLVSEIEGTPGDVLTYTLTVSNSHNFLDAHNIIMEDTIPLKTNLISVTGNYSVSGNLVTWGIGNLGPNESSQVKMVVQAAITATAGTIVNQDYSVRSDEVLAVIGEPVLTYIHMLAIEKEASAVAAPGSNLQYTLNVTNLQPEMATHHVILEDVIPDYTVFMTATMPHTLTGETLTWAIGDLAAGANAQVTLSVQIPITTPLGTIVNNQYSARSDEVDLIIGEPVSTTIHKLSVEKSAAAVVVRGYPLTYTLTVANLQPTATANQVVLSDTIPEGTTFITATGSHTVIDDLVTWEIGDLGAEDSASVDLVVQVPMTATGTIRNAYYGAISDEASKPARGKPVITPIYQPGATIQPTGEVWAHPGDEVILTRYLTNMGNYTDTFQIDVSSQGWTISSTENVTLGFQETHTITMVVNVPDDAQGGQDDIAIIEVSSSLDPNYQLVMDNQTFVYYREIFPLIFNEP